MTTDTPTTFDERYICATNASDLTIKERVRGPADIIIAVGLAGRPEDSGGEVPERVLRRHELASKLLWLQNEFDQAKAQIDLAKRYRSPMRDRAAQERAKLWHGRICEHGPSREAHFIEQAEKDEAAIVGGARSHIMLSLKTLIPAREALHRYGEIEATIRGHMITDSEVSSLIGPVLEAFLDPNCYRCGGRGVVGAYGTVQKICPSCHGTKLRFGRKNGKGLVIGKTSEQHRFSDHLSSEIGRMIEQMRSRSSGYLHNHD